MKILAHKNLNLHSASYPGGLVNVSAGRPSEVPDDIQDHPAYQWLIDEGTIVVLTSDPDDSGDVDGGLHGKVGSDATADGLHGKVGLDGEETEEIDSEEADPEDEEDTETEEEEATK